MPFHGGIFDAISGIFKSGASAVGGFLDPLFGAVTDFGGGAFASVDEALRGGTLSPGADAGLARQAGIGLGGIFTDIGTSFLTGQVQALTGATSRVNTSVRRAPSTSGAFQMQIPRTLGDQVAALAPTQFPFQPRTRTDQRGFAAAPTVGARDVSAASLGGLLGDIAGGALQQFLGPPTAPGRAIEQFFGFGGDAMASALPGGAAIPFAPVAPSGGRLFGATQNMMTGAVSVRPIKEIQAMNPATGRIHTWREKGRCLLWSDDLAAVKRVRRVARKAGRKR